ncbi:uncharacterized protein RSE6_03586 [Rhynchosporium secalis]|uniref:Peptidase M24 domain-containing protein n=1 Tax=Rhynchosporium secalis TaxID=38038 RepID=A0A1E1M353_RHYSE|nr:uncharacterized protein RSE6_03586 [Rhynchosporium secalis]
MHLSTLPALLSLLSLLLFHPTLTLTLSTGDIEIKSREKSSEPPREARYHSLPSLRECAKIQDGWTKERIEDVPRILRGLGVDAWLMTQREYAEDTAFWSLKSAVQFSARRRTVNLFIADPTAGTPSAYTWIDNTPGVYKSISKVLAAQDPKKIAVNINSTVAFSSGLHVGEFLSLKDNLDHKWIDRFVDEPMVAVEFIGTQPKAKLVWYRKMQETSWAMITEAFSERVIEAGLTSTEDVEWWMRSKIQEQNYTTWFQPDVTIITAESLSSPAATLHETFGERKREIIQRGDMLHVDFGITALGLNTDTQHLAYVLSPSQNASSIPPSYIAGLHKANRLQDIVISHMIPGRTGNQILASSLAQMRSEGFEGKIYCHPIGDWGHSAGTVIGMTNLQEGVPVLGDLELLGTGYYSVELSVEHWVEGRGLMMFYQEEDVYWDEESKRWEWVWGRQERFHLIRSGKEEGVDGVDGQGQMEL